MITVYINDKELSVAENQTILEICQEAGINIPTFCYDERLRAEGSCRICVVEVEGVGKLLPACTTLAAPNMKVKTHSPKVISMRKHLLAIMLSKHDISCVQCEKAGN
jgi:formate dehydrogenase major subunit